MHDEYDVNTNHSPGPPSTTAGQLTDALHARTATLADDTLTGRAPGFPTGGHAPREPLLPRWAWMVAALAVVASIVAGAVLGAGGESSSTVAQQIEPKVMRVGTDAAVQGQVSFTRAVLRGSTIRLELELKNLNDPKSDESWNVSDDFGHGSSDYDLSGVTLTLDGLPLNPASDADGKCECSYTLGTNLDPQGGQSVYAVYNVTKTVPNTVDVYVKGFGSWLDLPVTRSG